MCIRVATLYCCIATLASLQRSGTHQAALRRALSHSTPLPAQVFAVAGRDPLIDVALALLEAARADDYFVSRKLYPNVDFFSGLVYRALGFPPAFFTVLFAVPRVAGYLAHWRESLSDKDVRIARPQQDYRGVWLRELPEAGARPRAPAAPAGLIESNEHRRKAAGQGWL